MATWEQEAVDLRTVRLRSPGGAVRAHEVEQVTWHVPGWVHARCLTHGVTALRIDRADPAAHGLAAARECARQSRAPRWEARPLVPFPCTRRAEVRRLVAERGLTTEVEKAARLRVALAMTAHGAGHLAPRPLVEEHPLKTYQLASCSAGCAFHSTIRDHCDLCGSPMTQPQTVTREQVLGVLRGGADYEQHRDMVIRQLLGSGAVV